jgi:uncharacterized membrane protein YdfJ with MMPL/SSD domain
MNAHREEIGNTREAVVQAGVSRFRPILLTSLTTAAGITPLMLERSVQAQFLIPMAVALAFGVLFSTFITLGLVPALYVILEDFQKLRSWAWGTEPAFEALPEASAAGGAVDASPQQPAGAGLPPLSPLESPEPARPEIGYGSPGRRLRTLRPREEETGGD